MSPGAIRVAINSDQDIVLARQKARAEAIRLGFSAVEATFIATAVSELARNILAYARKGEIALQQVHGSARVGMEVIASDRGPGISDLRQAMRDGFSTSGSLGLGLPGVRRLMDEFEIVSEAGHGTRVVVRKWRK